MKRLLTTLAICLATTAFAADMPTVNVPTAGERMSSARSAIKAKNWRVAQAELNAAIKEEPNNADAHNLLAFSYRKQASPDLSRAFEHYNIALKLEPRHRGAHEYIGEAFLMDKKPAEAEKHLAELEKICGNKTCEEYDELARAIADYKAKNK